MRKRLRPIVLSAFCALLLLSPRLSSAQTLEPSFRSDVEKLLDVTGAAKIGTQIANMVSAQFLDRMRTAEPTIPPRALELIKEVLEAEFAKLFAGPEGLSEQIILVYARHFTQDDVRGMLAFYSTDLGKKVIATLPQVVQETGDAANQWATRNTPRITEAMQSRLRAEGFIK